MERMELISEDNMKSLSEIESACFDSICRSCLTPSTEMRNLFFKYKFNTEGCVLETYIHDLIYPCTQITMAENDGLPRFICKICTERALSVFAFRNQNRRSDEILKRILSIRQLQNNPENNILQDGMDNDQAEKSSEKQIDSGEPNQNTLVEDEDCTSLENSEVKIYPVLDKNNVSVKPCESKSSHKHNTRSSKLRNVNVKKSNSKVDLNVPNEESAEIQSDEVVANILPKYSNVNDKKIINPSQLKQTHSKLKKLSTPKSKESLHKLDDIRSVPPSFPTDTNNLQGEERQDAITSLIIDLKEEVLEDSSMCDIFDESDLESNESFPKEKKTRSKKQKAVILKNIEKKNRTVYAPLYEFPDKPQDCSVCSKSCPTVSALVKHRSEAHGSKKYQCITCGNGFTTTRGLRIHHRLHTGEKPEICTICGKAFSDPRTLKSHERIHSGDHPFPCPVCGKRFPARLPLAHHFRSHTGERPHQCQLCNKSYVQAHSLQVHMRTHTGVKPYPCDICGKAFTNNTSLSVHMLTHNGVKNFQCPICGKQMARSGELTVHLRTHSGERPFSCSICQKAFTNSGALRVHMPTHTGVKNFVCTVCGKRVARAIELRVHMRTHTGERKYSCQHCNKKFSTSSNMRLHERKHTGEKPFVCNECGRGFADSHVLRNHERTHTGERPHVCGTCGRGFAQHSSLRTHLNTHHKAARKISALQSTSRNLAVDNAKTQEPSSSKSNQREEFVNSIDEKLQMTAENIHNDSYNQTSVSDSPVTRNNIINANAIPMLKTVQLVHANVNDTLVPVSLVSTNNSSIHMSALNTGQTDSGMIISSSDGHVILNGNSNQLIKSFLRGW